MSYVTRANATLAYLALVLLLGGASAAGWSANLLLQILGAVLIGWALWHRPGEGTTQTGLRRFGVALAVLAAVQFLPLPPGLWQLLPGREAVHQGFAMIEAPAPWLTLSLAPWKTLASLVWLIPALALFVSVRASGGPETRHVVWTGAAVAAISVALGAMQQVAGSGYIYAVTNFGEGPGFFANSNHQGSFLLCALALWGGWLIGGGFAPGRRTAWYAGLPAVLGAIALLLVFGVLVSGSLACVALLVPVVGALVLMARPEWRPSLPLAVLGAVVLLGGFVAFLLLGPVGNDLTAKGVVEGISRQEFLATGSRIMADFAPTGSGLGTFQDLYRWYEDPEVVGTTFVNHAHDDLLELLIETGIFGLVAIVLFLGWYIPRVWRLWTGQAGHAVALAASIVIGVELAHSLVDYPLRTAAMSSMFAIACVLLVRPADALRPRNRARSGPLPDEKPREMLRI
jgi:O-antigen ligase